jgi:pimeloyl-ACP methyl ester carboxylesterase
MLREAGALDDLALTVYEAQCRAARFHSKSISKAGGLQHALAAFDGPLLLVWGEHDITAVPHELAPQLAGGRRDSAWHIVAGAGHWVQYERAQEVSALLDKWFRVA